MVTSADIIILFNNIFLSLYLCFPLPAFYVASDNLFSITIIDSSFF